jgi:hypothetical protein
MHYSLEEWSDFARKRAPVRSMEEMRRHLNAGCAPCAQVLAMWRSVLEVARRETDFQVPESGAWRAKALYSIAAPQRADSLPLRLARLVFSSSVEPLRVGVRGDEVSTCHLLFEEGYYVLDLHLKPEAERNVVSLAGQILDRSQSERSYRNTMVTLLCRNRELTRTTTNAFGEFQLEFSPGEDLLLAVRIDGEFVLVSALPGTGGDTRPH